MKENKTKCLTKKQEELCESLHSKQDPEGMQEENGLPDCVQ